jgi:hypothetical protein
MEEAVEALVQAEYDDWASLAEGERNECRDAARRGIQAALPAIEAELRERLLSEEVVDAVARIPWDNDFPGAWDKGVDPESEEDRDPRPQARSDVRSCIEAALATAFPTQQEDTQ